MENDLVHRIRDFNRFFVRSIGLLDKSLMNSGYSLTEAHILNLIYENKNTIATEINSVLQLDEGYLSRSIAKLVKQKLVVKKQSEQDKRAFTLSLSELGIQEYRKLDAYSSDSIRAKFSHLSKQDLLRLVDCLEEAKHIVNQDGA